jgi:hypothetical protein
MPKSLHEKAKADLQDIWMAATKKEANAAFDLFVETYGVKYENAVGKLVKDRDELLAFYDFPAEHWKHIRTTDVIDNPRFGKIRLWSSPNARRARSHQAARSARRAFHRASGTFWDSSCHRIAELDTAKHSRMPEHAPAGHAHTVASIRRTLSSQVTAGSVDGIITGRERPCGEARRSG